MYVAYKHLAEAGGKRKSVEGRPDSLGMKVAWASKEKGSEIEERVSLGKKKHKGPFDGRYAFGCPML